MNGCCFLTLNNNNKPYFWYGASKEARQTRRRTETAMKTHSLHISSSWYLTESKAIWAISTGVSLNHYQSFAIWDERESLKYSQSLSVITTTKSLNNERRCCLSVSKTNTKRKHQTRADRTGKRVQSGSRKAQKTELGKREIGQILEQIVAKPECFGAKCSAGTFSVPRLWMVQKDALESL